MKSGFTLSENLGRDFNYGDRNLVFGMASGGSFNIYLRIWIYGISPCFAL
jgi:hypothetical protein